MAAALCGASVAATSTQVEISAPSASKDLLATLKSASLLVSTEAAGNANAQDLFAAARADYGRLVGALYGAGYYGPVVHILIDGREASGIAPLDAPRQIKAIRVEVVPGPAFRFGTAQIAPLAPGTKLPDGFRTGAPAPSGMIEGAVGAAVLGWRDVGHAKAKAAGQKIVADHRTSTLDAQVTIVPGPAVTLGQLVVTGTSKVRRSRILAIAGFPTGTPYTPKKVETAANRLRRTGTFSSVALSEADTLGPGDTLDVTAAVVDQKRRRLGFGAAISSSEGASLTTYWMHRNLLGGAEQFRIDAEVDGIAAQTGGLSYKLSARLDRPATFNPDTSLYILGLIQRQNLTDYSADTLTLGTGLTRIVGDHLTLRYGLGFDSERVTDTTGVTAFRDVTLPLGATWDNRDNPLDAHRGAYVDLGLMPFVGFGGTGTGAQLKFDARGYRPLGQRVVLAARFQIGAILGAALASTPRDYLFYSGGGGTVRGQPYQSLGVYALSATQRSGGRAFMGLSGEVRTHVTKTIGLVAFYDAGYVGADSFSSGTWQAGAGLGLRYDTGIGPIRLDVAMPVSGSTGKGVQLYLGIGQAF
ncbi:MAG: BamA/TamA family outer membrane protein [Rhodobacteraceae bacterium]|nr:BamA/TamA family outer membrane protein [Paracoccaceae bacterium]